MHVFLHCLYVLYVYMYGNSTDKRNFYTSYTCTDAIVVVVCLHVHTMYPIESTQ